MAVEFKHVDYLKGGWELTRANLIPCVVAMVAMAVLGMIGIGCLLWGQIAVNLYKGFKASKESGKPMEIGSLFAFDHFVNNLIAYVIVGVVSMILGIIPLIGIIVAQTLFLMVGPILADKPETPFLDVVKSSVAFAKGNFVPSLIFVAICVVLMIVGCIPAGLGLIIVFPVTMAATSLAYSEHRAAVAAAASTLSAQLV
jgi:uncharacterized membrane protein